MDNEQKDSNEPVEVDETTLKNSLDLNNHDLYDEEVAAEIIDTDSPEVIEDNDNELQLTNNIYGWIAIALSLLSFFIMPYVFAVASIVLGFIARTRHRTILGNAAIGIGIISIIVRILMF